MSAAARYDWTPERVAELRRLWAEGLSSGLIARRLGVSRNAVIGKVYRTEVFVRGAPTVRIPSGSPWRGSPPKAVAIKPPELSTTAVAPKPKPAPPKSVAPTVAPKPAPVAPKSEPVALPPVASPTAVLLDLGAHQCKWPIGDPAREGFGFCGAARDGDSPYCAHHTRVAFVPQPKRASQASDLVRLAGKYR